MNIYAECTIKRFRKYFNYAEPWRLVLLGNIQPNQLSIKYFFNLEFPELKKKMMPRNFYFFMNQIETFKLSYTFTATTAQWWIGRDFSHNWCILFLSFADAVHAEIINITLLLSHELQSIFYTENIIRK